MSMIIQLDVHDIRTMRCTNIAAINENKWIVTRSYSNHKSMQHTHVKCWKANSQDTSRLKLEPGGSVVVYKL
jgi:hypothetical protein